jgi:excisionase family DNA binding protein
MQLITQAEAATQLRVSLSTLRRLRKAGELRFIPGRPVRVPVDDVNAFIERNLSCPDLRDTTRYLNGPTPRASGKSPGLNPAQAGSKEAAIIQRARRSARLLSFTGRIGSSR